MKEATTWIRLQMVTEGKVTSESEMVVVSSEVLVDECMYMVMLVTSSPTLNPAKATTTTPHAQVFQSFHVWLARWRQPCRLVSLQNSSKRRLNSFNMEDGLPKRDLSLAIMRGRILLRRRLGSDCKKHLGRRVITSCALYVAHIDNQYKVSLTFWIVGQNLI